MGPVGYYGIVGWRTWHVARVQLSNSMEAAEPVRSILSDGRYFQDWTMDCGDCFIRPPGSHFVDRSDLHQQQNAVRPVRQRRGEGVSHPEILGTTQRPC